MPPIGNRLRYPVSQIAERADYKKRKVSELMVESMLGILSKRRKEMGWRGAISNVLAKSKVAYYDVDDLPEGSQMSAWLQSDNPTKEAVLYTQPVYKGPHGSKIEEGQPRVRAVAYEQQGLPMLLSSEVDQDGLTPAGKKQFVEDVLDTVNLVFEAEGIPELTFPGDATTT